LTKEIIEKQITDTTQALQQLEHNKIAMMGAIQGWQLTLQLIDEQTKEPAVDEAPSDTARLHRRAGKQG
jgi:hypothetical protein